MLRELLQIVFSEATLYLGSPTISIHHSFKQDKSLKISVISIPRHLLATLTHLRTLAKRSFFLEITATWTHIMLEAKGMKVEVGGILAPK